MTTICLFSQKVKWPDKQPMIADNTSQRKQYPVLPLRDTVLFPSNVTALFVGREKSMAATSHAMDHERYIILVTQKDSDALQPGINEMFQVGVLAEILQLLKMPDGTFKVLLEAVDRGTVENLDESESFLRANFKSMPLTTPSEGSNEEKLQEELLSSANELFEEILSEEDREQYYNDESSQNPEYQINFIAQRLNIHYKQKQDILETADQLEMIKKIIISLENDQQLRNLDSSISDKVRSNMDRMQREYFLNEQIKVIREELGDNEHDELHKYRVALDSGNLPEDIEKKGRSELKKIEKMPPMSSEYGMIRNYLDWLLDIPYNEKTEDNLDIQIAKDLLSKTHFGLKKVKERLLEFIAVRRLAPEKSGAILCLLGPPGVGKTSLAKSLAESLNRKFVRIALGGVRDEAEIRGHRRTYIGALPGRIITGMKKAGVKNPVILLDEIDKMSSDYRGNPAAALLEVLDPEQNKEFTDHYLEASYDLSDVLFVATANAQHNIPGPLLDRLEVLEIPGYTEMEKIHIAQSFLFGKEIESCGLSSLSIEHSKKSLALIIRQYTREAGLRQLQREIAKICRKIAREFLETQNENYILNRESIIRFLGPAKYALPKRDETPLTGKVNGLAWTATGGEVLDIEVALAHGTGKLTLTGNLGDIMKESAGLSLSYLKSQAHLLSIPKDFFEKTDFFLHLPQGAIPKDGPSAGIGITLAFLSAVLQIPVRSDIAMTGEVTLRGQVLEIGGLKEKLLAAYMHGIFEAVIPKSNKKDLEELPLSVRKKMKIHLAEDVRTIFNLALTRDIQFLIEKAGSYPFQATHLPQ